MNSGLFYEPNRNCVSEPRNLIMKCIFVFIQTSAVSLRYIQYGTRPPSMLLSSVTPHNTAWVEMYEEIYFSKENWITGILVGTSGTLVAKCVFIQTQSLGRRGRVFLQPL